MASTYPFDVAKPLESPLAEGSVHAHLFAPASQYRRNGLAIKFAISDCCLALS